LPGPVRPTLLLLVALLLMAAPLSALAFQQGDRPACCNADSVPPGPDEDCPNPVCCTFPIPLSDLNEPPHAPHLPATWQECAREITLAPSAPPSSPAEIPPETF